VAALALLAWPDAALRAQAEPPRAAAPLVVRPAAGAARRVPVVLAPAPLGAARFVRAADLAAALGGTAAVTGDRVRLTVAGVVVEAQDGVLFARVDGREVPLALAPTVADGAALLPFQVVADLLPEAAPSLAFEAGAAARPETGGGVLAVVRPAVATVLPSLPPRPRASDRPADRPGDPPAARLPAAAGRRTVVVDAGHGGPDAGMRGPIVGGVLLTEKEVTLGVARALRDALAARDVDVVMTRTTDTLVALADRGRIANARRGDLFVSIHVNAANPGWREPTAARGFETYFLSDARTEDARQVAERENESVRYEAAASADGDPLRFIVSDLAQNAHLRASSRLAAAVQRRLGRVHPGPNRGVHQAGFKVLVTASMPAVLVETGFGSNPAEAAYLASEHGQREIAEAIADAVVEHLGRYGGARGGGVHAPEPSRP
jgi:N-acetylmuramoyl-L-alanine amidase